MPHDGTCCGSAQKDGRRSAYLVQSNAYRGAKTMDLDNAFNDLQSVADANPDQVTEARERRQTFKDAFKTKGEVIEVFGSGSLARSTQRDPINDVDLVVVFDPEEHPDWAKEGSSAGDALEHTQGLVRTLLGTSEGTFDQIVRRADPRNHAVKCFLGDPDDPDGFTVDVMPALRHEGHLLVPEKANRKWIETDPEYMIHEVADRQKEWGQFRNLVRVVKMWSEDRNAGMKSLTVEVLALKCLHQESSRGRALQRFFSAAELAIDRPIEDPAGLCDEIQPDLDVGKAKEKISAAATDAWKAIDAQDCGETDRAACLWRRVFGDAFPEPDDGCADPEEEKEASGTFGIGTGAAGGGAIGIDEPRPVRDSPQG